MSSSRQLLADGHAKRADLLKVLIQHIFVEPGFNVPESPEDFEARVEAMVLHLEAGGRLPPIEVRDRADGGVFVVDGHARLEAYVRAHARGIPVADPKDGNVYLLTIPFTGNDADRVLRTITSAEGRTLSPLQLADRYKTLQAFGWSASEIARKVGKTAQHVSQVLTLGNANSDVQKAVQAGEVSATEAVKAVKKHKDKAGAVIAEQLVAAKTAGKKKVTNAVVTAAIKEAKKVIMDAYIDDALLFRWLCDNSVFSASLMGDKMEVSFDAPEFADFGEDSMRGAITRAMALPKVAS